MAEGGPKKRTSKNPELKVLEKILKELKELHKLVAANMRFGRR